ncbi:MAG: universal stress protein, partial [Pseudomonadales bacterium]
QQHRRKLNELLKGFDIPNEDVHLVRGEVVPNLIKFLNSSHANVLVVGALSRNVVERAIVGNTAEKILENCPCDILVLKSPN